MKVYTAHSRTAPTGDPARDTDGLVFVKDGFSIWAALFPLPWFLINLMWIPLLVYLALSIGFSVLAQSLGFSDSTVFLIALVLGLLIGFEANTIRRWSLSSKGYRLVGIGSGSTREECERRVYEKLVAAAARPISTGPGPGLEGADTASPRLSVSQAPIVGLFPEPGR
ncbi:MAG: DUF2628 domain-containing protein [Pseudomonadota bacterium]